jgi:protein O-GlcNAc transferase
LGLADVDHLQTVSETSSTLARALELHRVGNLAEAERMYRGLLATDSRQADAWHLLGLIQHQRGEHSAAVEHIERAIALHPASSTFHANLATVWSMTGQFDRVAACLEEALRLTPQNADLHVQLARAYQAQGKFTYAVARYRESLRLRPDQTEVHNHLGHLLTKLGQVDEAVVHFRRLVELLPQQGDAFLNLGIALEQQKRVEEALAAYQQGARLAPDEPALHNNLGNLLRQLGRLDEAIAAYQQAVRLRPLHAEMLKNLGKALRESQRLNESLHFWHQALMLRPSDDEAYLGMGGVLSDQGRHGDAAHLYREALRFRPNSPQAHDSLAMSLMLQGRIQEAVRTWREGIRLHPDNADLHAHLGIALTRLRQLSQAAASLHRAVELDPSHVEAVWNLGLALGQVGKIDEAAEYYRRAIELQPSRTTLRLQLAALLPPIYVSSEDLQRRRAGLIEGLRQLRGEGVQVDLTYEYMPTLFLLPYQGGADREIVEEFVALGAAPPSPVARRPVESTAPATTERIKLGLISRYFHDHTIGELMRGVIAHLPRDKFEVYVLSFAGSNDAVAQFIRQHADRYIELPTQQPAARQIIADLRLDVLFYTDVGMDALTWSLAFSRLAPVQCTTWGHPVTTGLKTIDYYLSSESFESESGDANYTEKLVRLKGLPCYCYRPATPSPALPRSHFNLPEEAHVYGCFQSLFKFHPDFDALIGEILRRDSQGIVVLAEGFDPHWRELLWQRFATTIPDVLDRIRVLRRVSAEEFQSLNLAVDVLLDTIHFNGGNTNFKGLAVGTPIVTWPSEFLKGRITLGMYRQMDVLDCVARSAQEYVEIAVRLATDAAWRETIRSKILAANHVLFENQEAVREMAGFFEGVVR